MYTLRTTKKFNKSLRQCIRQGKDVQVLRDAVEILVETGSLPTEYRSHKLRGKYAESWECHIEDDWLLIWRQDDDKLTLLLTNTGTHKELFHPTSD